MKKAGLFLLLWFPLALCAQEKYWVCFKDKGCDGINGLPGICNPGKNSCGFEIRMYPTPDCKSGAAFVLFDTAVFIRRATLGIPWDEKDLPVSEVYIEQLLPFVDSLGYSSRWLNTQAVYTSEERMDAIRQLPFVADIIPISSYSRIAETISVPGENEVVQDITGRDKTLQLARYQTERLGAPYFRQKGLDGKGIRIAIIDAGFSGVESHPAFRHIRDQNHILKTFDFIRKKENVYLGSTHGTMVLSCIGGIEDSLVLGLAPEAEFLLARTEYVWADTHNDEDRWIAALEWAEQNGADLVNSSLGYTFTNHFPYQLDGKSPVSRAANIAAAKGMLVISSAGNEYNNQWKFISLPADADSLLTVGATDPFEDVQANFSSIGPTADGRLKPNVTAPGVCGVIDGNRLITASGTSFSSPLITGFAACVLQLRQKKIDAVQLKTTIERSGHLFPYYDYAHGYGIPQAQYILKDRPTDRKFRLEETEKGFLFVPYSNAVKDSNDYKLLYYHVQGTSGTLRMFNVVALENDHPFELQVQKSTVYSGYDTYRRGMRLSEFIYPGETLRVFFEGYYEEYIFRK